MKTTYGEIQEMVNLSRPLALQSASDKDGTLSYGGFSRYEFTGQVGYTVQESTVPSEKNPYTVDDCVIVSWSGEFRERKVSGGRLYPIPRNFQIYAHVERTQLRTLDNR